MPGPGSLLREARQYRGMDIHQAAEAIRLRPHLIEAIELEKWDQLPQPVFVKGFIRSYARALGLDEREVLDLYNRAAPSPQTEPKPLLKPEKSKRSLVALLILAIVILAGGLVYFRQGKPVEDGHYTATHSPGSELEAPGTAMRPPVEDGVESAPSVPSPDEDSGFRSPPRDIDTPPPAEPDRAAEQRPVPAGIDSFPLPPEQEQVLREEVPVLEIDVHDKTWIRVSVDGEKPNAFLFQPGSRPGWKEGGDFDLLIGNAGGISIIFEGKTYRDIGKSGEVVRLRLPQDLDSLDRGDQ